MQILGVSLEQGCLTFFLVTQVSVSKSYATLNRQKCELTKASKWSLLSFTEFIKVLGYFDPRSAKWFVVVFLGGHKRAHESATQT